MERTVAIDGEINRTLKHAVAVGEQHVFLYNISKLRPSVLMVVKERIKEIE